MTDSPDDTLVRRGQDGVVQLFSPELEIQPVAVPEEIAAEVSVAADARELMAGALLDEIDAIMPSHADFVNYEMNAINSHLVISEALGEWGVELELEPFARVEGALVWLGQPYLHFDGDLVINSVDDYGWERTQPYSESRAGMSRAAGAAARDVWAAAMIDLQRAALSAIWRLMPSDVEALEFIWSDEGACLRFVALIRPDGLSDDIPSGLQDASQLASYITEPCFTDLLHNELSGRYRHQR